MTLPSSVDCLVIGGGINGTGIARDASGRGLSVLLCEQSDLGAATSSASTKLIHGGLRYLEHYEFRLVRDALLERERLLEQAPHLIQPMTFVLPHQKHLRPKWLIRLGLFFYDHLAKRQSLPGSKAVKLAHLPGGNPLRDEFRQGFQYADCWVDDARLVVANAMAAEQRGAYIANRMRCIHAEADAGLWRVTLENTQTGETYQLTTKLLINAAGPWVNTFFESVLHCPSPHDVRLVKGSHLVVPRLYEGEHAFLLQMPDGRVVFTIPYQENLTLIGTTDETISSMDQVAITEDERDYLLNHVNAYFKHQLTPADIVWTYAGARPLLDDGSDNASEVTRDYKIVEQTINHAPMISLFGGKITTYRKVAEQVVNAVVKQLKSEASPWTAHDTLPGGGCPNHDIQCLIEEIAQEYPSLPKSLLKRWCRSYGTLVWQILDGCSELSDLGQCFGTDLYQAEVDYLVNYEWASTAEDILWRRSKLGLCFTENETQQLATYLEKSTINS